MVVSGRAVAMVLLLVAQPSRAQTISTWTPVDGSRDWHDTANWSDGVPQLPGDQAIVPIGISGTPVLNAPVTLGQLAFGQAMGSASIEGTETLTFDQPGEGPARVTIPLLRRDLEITLFPSVAIAAGETLEVDVSSRGSLQLAGPIQAGSGDIVKLGGGTLALAAGNAAWTGRLEVGEGGLIIRDVHALLNAAHVGVAKDASITFVSQGETGQHGQDYLVPRIVLDGGALQDNLSPRFEQTNVAADIELASDSLIRVTSDDILRLQGSITGPAGLRFEQLFDPQADLRVDSTAVEIAGPTSYSGPTVIGPNIRVAFEHPEALGDRSSGTFVDRGTLELRHGGSGEQIEVFRGTLQLGSQGPASTHQVALHESSLRGGPIASLVEYSGGIVFGTAGLFAGPTLQGGIQGKGSIYALDVAEIAGVASVRGNIFVPFRGPVRLSGTLNLAGDVYLSDGELELAGDLGAPEGHFYVLPDTPRMTVSHDNTLEALTLDPRRARRVYGAFFENFSVSAIDGATLTIADELHFFGGVLRGRFAGQQVLTKKDTAPGYLEDIAGSEFRRIDVNRGSLTISGNVGDTPPDIHLSGHFSASAGIFTSSDYTGDIYLNNTRDLFAGQSGASAALTLGAETTVRGDIFLGDKGSSIFAVGGNNGAGTLAPESQIHGGDLTILGEALRIRGGQHTFSGVTRIMNREVVLEGDGRLNSTSMIVGSGRFSSSTGGRATLVLDSSTLIPHGDRIPDATPVYLNGMQLKLIGSDEEQVTETLGNVFATRALSEVVVQHPAATGGQSALVIDTLNRSAGAAIRFDAEQPNASIRFVDAPVLDDGLLGGWAIVRGRNFPGDMDFATYGPSGVVAYRDLHTYANDLSAASANDNVLVEGQSVVALASDKNINALKVRNTDIDLNGQTLTLESGGLLLSTFFGDEIRNGQLTAGTSANAELMVSGLGQVEASIVDNAHGSVGLTYSQDSGGLVLSGHNTYSGPTVVNSGNGQASLTVASETALPGGSDIVLNGGDLRLNFDSTAPLVLGEMVLRDRALVRSTSNSNPIIQPARVHIESGAIFDVAIVGNAPIVKTTSGSASLSNSLADHTGPVDIQQGALGLDAIGEAPLDDAHAITVRGGAIFSRAGTELVFAGRKVRLDGGIYDGGHLAAPIEVLPGGGTLMAGGGTSEITSVITGDGTLNVEGEYGNRRMEFNADLNAFTGDLLFTGGRTTRDIDSADYSGNVTIAAAQVTVSQPLPFGTGRVTVTPEGMLTVANEVTAHVVLDGGIVSFQAATLDGDVHVVANSRFFLLNPTTPTDLKGRLASTTHLHDQVNLSVLGSPAAAANSALYLSDGRRAQLELSGSLIVNGAATITSFDAKVELTGTIEPGVPQAILNLEGNDTFDLRASILLAESRSLSIFEDGEPAAIQLVGGSHRLAGEGTLGATVSIANGASIAPGNSPGTLTIDGSLAIEPGGVYDWEVDASGHDMLIVADTLSFTATPESPWRFDISDLGGGLAFEDSEWLVASAATIVGFDSSAVQIVATTANPAFELSMADRFALEVRGSDVYLLLTVPEPSSLAMLGCLGALLLGLPRGLPTRAAYPAQ